MKALPSTVEPSAFPSDLLVRCPLALDHVEVRLFILALGCLHQQSQRLPFQLTFADVLPDGNVDDQFAQLDKAQKRLMQPLK